ncbi:hypothetical protein M405DRAFT_845300 [Rhizopogon salebrosus TDB-379]|nr:hypothetical protein M405DRAFT_845300 [Rhizopogon salebrosus TDB-379]
MVYGEPVHRNAIMKSNKQMVWYGILYGHIWLHTEHMERGATSTATLQQYPQHSAVTSEKQVGSKRVRDYHIWTGRACATVRDHKAAVRDHRMTMRDHRMTVHDHRMTVRDHRMTVRDHRMTVRDHRMTVRDHRPAVRDHRKAVRDNRKAVRDTRMTVRDNRMN